MGNLIGLLPYLLQLLNASSDIKKYIDIGTPLFVELQKSNPKIIPVLEAIGTQLFPKVQGTIHIVAAAADAIFNPHGVMWIQNSLNTLDQANLTVDGSYGKATKAAVTKFQTAHPESGIADGWVGPKTEKVIVDELSKLTK